MKRDNDCDLPPSTNSVLPNQSGDDKATQLTVRGKTFLDKTYSNNGKSSWTADRERRLRELWPTDRKIHLIAEELKVSVPSISWYAKKIGLPPRYNVKRKGIAQISVITSHYFPDLDYQYLVQAATRRRISIRKLLQNTVNAIARDRMVDAVLDD